MKIRILGIGSPFGDDRFGWEAAEALRHSAAMNAVAPGRIEIQVLDRPGTMLPAHWQETDIVILLDAVRSGATPGTRHCLEAPDLPGTGMLCSSHGFGIAPAIELARALGNMPSQLLVRGVEADSSWTGFSLSPAVADALPAFVVDIAQEALALTGFYSSFTANRA
ncbi:MAG: hydrogenase maturation protease [Sulfuricaulis sp.]